MLRWLIAAVVLYGGFVALLYVAQRLLQYFPERPRTSPSAVDLAEAEETVLNTSDGERVIVWHVLPRGEQPVFLYFHGNGGSLCWRAERFRALIVDGSGLIALSYRGYGGSSGRPTETGLIEDAAPRVTRSISACTIRSTTLGKFSSSHDSSMGRSTSRTTSSSVSSCFFTVSISVLNVDPTAAVAWLDSKPASGIGFAPASSPELRGLVGANVLLPASSAVIARRMAANASSINSSSPCTGCRISASNTTTP